MLDKYTQNWVVSLSNAYSKQVHQKNHMTLRQDYRKLKFQNFQLSHYG